METSIIHSLHPSDNGAILPAGEKKRRTWEGLSMAAITCRHWDFLTSSSSASLTWHCDFFVEANLHVRRGIRGPWRSYRRS